MRLNWGMTTSAAASIPLTLIGGPTTLIEYAGLRIVTDPTFDLPSSYGPDVTGYEALTLVKTMPPAVTPDELGEVHVVLASHDHWDNLDAAGRKFAAEVPHVFTTDVVAKIVPGAEPLAEWESRTVRTPNGRIVSFTAVPAHHGPEGIWQAIGPVIGFIVEAPGERTIYISGDNSDVDVVREIARRFPKIEVALLFVGGPSFEALGPQYITFSDETATEAAEVLAGATIVPVHADSWEHFSQTTASMKKLADERGIGDRVIALAPGETAMV